MSFSFMNRFFHFKNACAFRDFTFRYSVILNVNYDPASVGNSQRQFSVFRTRKSFNNCPQSLFKRNLEEIKCSSFCKRFYHRPTSNSFVLDEYDCIGFDLDNTISEYNLESAVRMEYDTIAKFLVTERGYNETFLFKPLLKSDIDFIQRGLIVDTFRGNLLRIRGDGVIFKASHGSKLLNDKEIENIYGKDKKWHVTTEFAKNPVITWNGPLSDKMRTFSDYFDMPAALALARCVDSVENDSHNDVDYFKIWKDVLKGLVNMYNRHNFSLNEGGYFPTIKSNPNLYYNRCRPSVVKWLKELKQRKVVFLITGSNVDFASHTASYCLGENWKEYFDIIICYSRKPGFFLGGRPFVKLNGFTEMDTISNDEMKIGGLYHQGNWQGLYEFLSKSSGKMKPRCLYIGDNLIQDIFTVSEYTCCDTVAITEELSAEFFDHSSKSMLVSDYWGSYFSVNNIPTVWGHIIENYSKICIPNLDALASKPFDFKFSSFKSVDSGYQTLTSSFDLYKKSVEHEVRV